MSKAKVANDMKALISAVTKLTVASAAKPGSRKRKSRSYYTKLPQSFTQGQAGANARRTRPRMGQSASMAGSLNVSAPSSVGVVVSNSYFRMDGKAQSNTEFSGMGDSCRVVGCDLYGTSVASGASSNGGFGSGAVANLSPSAISPRLTNLEELFQYYAIRELQIQYIPAVGSTTAVAVALGVSQDALDATGAVVSYTTQQKVLELTPSVLTPAWQSAMMTYRHNGVKVWRTSSTSAGSSDDYLQAALIAVLLGNAASTTYGQLRMQYVIDFYKPTPVESSPSLVFYKKQLLQARREAAAEKLGACVVKLPIGSKDAKDGNDAKRVEFDDTKSLSGAEAAKLFADPDKIYPERFVLVKRPQSASMTAASAAKP